MNRITNERVTEGRLKKPEHPVILSKLTQMKVLSSGKTRWIRVLLILLLLNVAPFVIADDDDERWENEGREHESEIAEEISESIGTIALWGFLLLNGLHYYSMGFKRIPKGARTSVPGIFKWPLKWKNRFRHYHYWGNPVLIGIALLHGITAEESNRLVWIGWGLMALLAVTGLIMKLQRADQPGAKVTRLLHMQHLMSVLMIISLLAGHLPLD